MRPVRLAALCVVLLLVRPPSVSATANAGAASWQIPVDVRAEGMGRAFAVLNPSPFAARANPGALGLIRGFEAGAMKSQLVPDLAPGVMIEYQGLAAALPLPVPNADVRLVLHLNRTWLDYGISIATGPGQELGTFSSWEESYGGGFAVGIGSWAAFGMAVKEVEVNLAPQEYGDGRGTVLAWSYGVLVRPPALVLRGTRERGLRLRPSAGVSSVHHGHLITLTDSHGGDPLPETFHVSAGAELAVGSAADVVNTTGAVDRALRDVPLAALTVAAGFEDDQTLRIPEPYRNDLSWWQRHGRTGYGGLEIKLLGMFAGRWGYIHDDVGKILNPTWGIGVEVPGLFGLDFASIPQYYEFDHVHKASVWARVAF